MQHILVAIPTPEKTYADFALGNLQDIIHYTHTRFPDWKITTSYHYGTRTDQNRNFILQEALKDESISYILWLDEDMLYPKEIIERYFDTLSIGQTIDVIGCLYFKRAYPYDPIAYELSGEKMKPYRTILPSTFREDTIYEVDGIGYGGMMVRRGVYEALGEQKWTHYGANFHLPFDAEDHLTHDLVFCQDVKALGFSIKLHGGVRPGHLMNKPITIEDWRDATEKEFVFKKRPPKVQIIMPVTNTDLGKKAALIMQKRAGADCDIAIVHDDQSKGFVHIVNQISKMCEHEIVCYTAQDALVGEDWLKHALLRMTTTNAGLVAFHDGKWGGRLASFGLVQRSWYQQLYGGDLFYPKYWGNYADTELTQIAKQQKRFAYAEKAVMLEVDYDKALGQGKGTVKSDKKLFKERKKTGFDGKVSDPTLLEEFS